MWLNGTCFSTETITIREANNRLNWKEKPKLMCSGWLLTSACAPLWTWMLPYSSNACKTFSIFPGTTNYSVCYAKPYQAVSTLVHCLQVCNLTRVYFRQQYNIIFSIGYQIPDTWYDCFPTGVYIPDWPPSLIKTRYFIDNQRKARWQKWPINPQPTEIVKEFRIRYGLSMPETPKN